MSTTLKSTQVGAPNLHTSGPWEADGFKVIRTDIDGETLICEALPIDYDASDKERAANARLIATAPELLKVMENLVKAVWKHGAFPMVCPAMQVAQTVMKKATGVAA